MKRTITSAVILLGMACSLALAAGSDTRCYELRTYYAAPGKLDDLNARFRNHTVKLFEKHGIVNIGYWMPIENPDHKLVYVLAFPSRAAREQSWKDFGGDPAWKEVVKTTEASGRLVTKVESVLMSATDFSPEIKPANADPKRCYELRTYTASPGNLAFLLARFRNHTLKLFEKHGIKNFAYWIPMEKNQGAENTLIYLVIHDNPDAAAKSFNAFRADPDWIEAKKASETNGSLTTEVKSVMMRPTDYSPAQ
ncbi:MAG TPA: NIPSNAP family protein [Candidatus Paceibacterota bacterium]|nr:NIPSNAP family protein [Verrucomicrobiota bacterium]HRY51452.1 NIPSNAP family protein [Candidatus Paceibacterota bacterium]HRZ99498.1 NIPSNAP family protein [Candidatus Paceibacterota bacterium]